MSELKWKWAYYPYLDAPNKQKESALKAGYIKVVSKSEADKVIAEKDEEIAQLQAMLEERNKQVGELKEERRWRKCSEEKPKEEDEYYLVFDKYGYRDTDRWRKDKMGVWGFSVHGETVRYFMPLPSAPKEYK